MNFEQNIRLKNKLIELNIADENTMFIVSHITHNHAGLHEEIENYFKESGIKLPTTGFHGRYNNEKNNGKRFVG